MYLYHVTKEEFTCFVPNSGCAGCGGRDFGDGIYLLTDTTKTQNILNHLKWKHEHHSTKTVLSINDEIGVFENVYASYLINAKGFNAHAVQNVLEHYKKTNVSTLPWEELVLFMDCYTDTYQYATLEEIEKVADFFADKKIHFSKKEVPFNGRVLKVKLADDARIWEEGKTLTENGYTYDFEHIWRLIEKTIMAYPTDLYAVFRCFLGWDKDRCWHNQQLILKAVNRWRAKSIETAHLMCIAKRLFQSSVAHTTAKEWPQRLPLVNDETKQQLAALFPYDGTVIRNARIYDQDVYVIRNPEKLTIESYKPYGLHYWIPINEPLVTHQRLRCFRIGGLERC